MANTAEAQNISTVAGGASPVGLTATVFSARSPSSVAVDSNGNVYLTTANQVWIVNSAGIVTGTIGSGAAGYTGDGGPASNATLNLPAGVAVDSAGNIYIADQNNNVVRQVTAATGIITTIAGNGSYGFSNDPGASAPLAAPAAVAVDSAGNLYIADATRRVRKLSLTTGLIATVAGNSTFGYSGDGGQATNAQLSFPSGVAVDSAGNIYIADTTNNVIREVTAATGVINTIAGGGTGAGSGVAATSVALDGPAGIVLDSRGNLYFADSANCVIRKFTVGGNIATVAGNGSCAYTGDGGAATSAALNSPFGVTLDSAGDLYIADAGNNVVRKVTAATGHISTFAGNGAPGLSGNGGAATSAQLVFPGAVAVDGAGNLYITDILDNVIRKVTAATGIISTFAGTGTAGYSGDGEAATSAQLNQPSGVVFDAAGNLYIADANNSVIRRVTPGGMISTVAGDHTPGYGGDSGAATSAALYIPEGVAVDSVGNIYIADSGNNVIRKVSAATGIITTIAGTPNHPGYDGDSGPATSAHLNEPFDVAVDSSGNVFVSDSGNNVIRMVTAATGTISTIAGNGREGYAGDGGPATGAELNFPWGIAVDAAGNVYTAAVDDNAVRKFTPGGNINTIAGTGTIGFSGDGGPATSAELASPEGVAVTPDGQIYIADSGNDRIRKVAVLAGPATHFTITAPATAASGVAFNNLVVTALDANNIVATGYTGTVHFTSTDATALLPANSTLTNGTATFSATLKTVGGRSITATDTVTGTITGTTATISVTAGPVTHFTMTAPPAATAGVAFNNLVVTALDASNNVVTSYTGAVHFTSTDAVAVLPANSTLTNGTGTFNATLQTAGNQTITATDTVTGTTTGTTATITVSAGAATHFTVTAPAAATAGIAFNNLVVTALDAGNNVVAGYTGTVHFTSTDTAAVMPANSTLTNGTATFSATLKTIGNQTITATDTVTGAIAGTTATISVSAGPATHFTVTAPAAATTGAALNNLVVTALDANNNVVSGYAGTVHFSSSDAAALLPANSTLTNGTGTFGATLKTAGNQTISATDTVTGTITGTTGTISVSAAPATHFTVTAPAAATAGAAFNNLVLTALDANNNVATGYAGTVHFTSTDAAAVLPANSTLTNGTATFSATLKTTGNRTITATDTVTGSITGTTGTISVGAGAATHFTITAPAAAVAGVAFNNLLVTAFDAGNNVVSGYAGTVHFTSTDVAALLPVNSALTNGTATFSATLKTTGNQTITATDTVTGTITGTSGTISVSAGAATHFTVTAPAATTTGVAFNNLVVTALDASNNVATAYAGTVHFTSTDAIALLPPNSTLTNGTGTLSATLKTSGNQTITASDTVAAAITGTSGGIAVTRPVLTVAANSLAINVGSPIPTLTASITGFVNGDTAATAFTGAPTLLTTATAASGGSYPITVTAGTLAAVNYTFAFVNGTLTIAVPSAAPSPQVFYSPPVLTMSYGAASIPLGGTTTLTFSLSNPNSTYNLSGIGFTDTLPPGLIVSSPGISTSSCGSVAVAAGSVGVSGGSLAFGGTCSFSVTVMAVEAGTLNNTTSPVASTEALNGAAASASLTVTAGSESITNSGSFTPGALTPNLILSYFGPVFCLPNEQVLINGTAAQILSATASQINFVSPGSLAAGPANVQIACGGEPPVILTVPSAPVNPAIFTISQNGKGQGAIVNLDGTINSSAARAPQGGYVSVFGTGFGALAPAGNDGLRHLAGNITASIGSVNAPVVYAGEAPGETSGLQQINLEVPNGLTAGPAVPIILTVNGVSTQVGVTMAVD